MIYRKRHETDFMYTFRRNWSLWIGEILLGAAIGVLIAVAVFLNI